MEEKDEYLEMLIKSCKDAEVQDGYNDRLMAKLYAETKYAGSDKKGGSIKTRRGFYFYDSITGLSFLTTGIAMIAFNIWGGKLQEIMFMLKNVALNFNIIVK